MFALGTKRYRICQETDTSMPFPTERILQTSLNSLILVVFFVWEQVCEEVQVLKRYCLQEAEKVIYFY